jgi:hypothetical protein
MRIGPGGTAARLRTVPALWRFWGEAEKADEACRTPGRSAPFPPNTAIVAAVKSSALIVSPA